MLNTLIALSMFLSVFILLSISVVLGRRHGLKEIARHPHNKLEVVGVAEGAVFALLGLLIAFTFSGAYDRFEGRKVQTIEEANAIETAYLRLGLLPAASQPELQSSFREYMHSRLTIYKDLPYLRKAKKEWEHTQEIKTKLWNQALIASQSTKSDAASEVLLPAINAMFDMANSRYEGTKIHSPGIIFFLLIGIASLSSFLAGFGTAKHEMKKSVYILIYVLITSFTIYIILDMEFPRMGFIRVDAFDKVLEETSTNLNKNITPSSPSE
jgi:hypothetical protein